MFQHTIDEQEAPDTPAVAKYYTFTASGQMFADTDQGIRYGSIVVQHRNETGGITYESLPIGETRTFYGFNFRFYVTDFSGAAGDNSGLASVTATEVVPEPGAAVVAGAVCAGALFFRRRG